MLLNLHSNIADKHIAHLVELIVDIHHVYASVQPYSKRAKHNPNTVDRRVKPPVTPVTVTPNKRCSRNYLPTKDTYSGKIQTDSTNNILILRMDNLSTVDKNGC